MEKIKLNDIRIDGGTQIRVVLDQNRVYHYRDCMLEGDVFPLIKVRFDGSNYWLYGGFHRYHAMRLLGIKEAEVDVKPGTQKEAQYDSLQENYDHGLPLSIKDRRNKVLMAIKLEGEEASDRHIAKIARVSPSFVGSIRRPEVKGKQAENRKKSADKAVSETSSTKSVVDYNKEPEARAGEAPDESEIKAAELAMQADQDAMYKLLESDDALATAHEEIKRLNHLNAQLEIRLHGLMNERNEAVKMVKKLQKENDKLKAKK